MPDYMPQPPAYVPTRADALQNQPPTKWLTLRMDDLLVDAAFVVAYDLPLTPDSRAAVSEATPARSAAAATCSPHPTDP